MANYRERVISVLGSTSVGKSALTLMFIQNEFVENYDPTIAKSYTKTLSLNNNSYSLTVNDTAGLEEQSEIPTMYQNSDGYIFVYSITNRQSFLVVKTIYDKLIDLSGVKQPALLVGNKSDLEGQRRVSLEEGRMLAEAIGANFLETSAKDPKIVVNAFETLLKKIDPQEIQATNPPNNQSNTSRTTNQESNSGSNRGRNNENSKGQTQKCTIS